MTIVQSHVESDGQSTLYEEVAQRICRLIEAGTLRPGERIPSVRKLSQQIDVSVSTVLQAYRLLENRGQVEARPQSGYFVRGTHWQRAPEPQICGPSDGCTAVTVAELAERVMLEGRRTDLVHLGAALHGSEAMPIRQLNRIAAAVARRSPAAGMTYCVPPGDQGLCVQVARRALDAGAALSPDDVIVTSGAMEAIGFCLRAVTQPGDAVAIESPTFYGILQLLDVLNLRAVEVPPDPRTGVCLDALAAAMDRAAADGKPVRACLFVGNFKNPLGSCMPDDQKQRLVEMLADREVPLIEDDIYGELSFDGRRPRTAKSFDTTGNVLLCSSVSKTLAPGYRVGWCAPGRHYEKVRRLKLFTNVATATLPQKAVAEFLATGGYDHHLRRVRRSYHENLMRVAAAVAEHFPPGTKLTRPHGGMVLWVELPDGSDALKLHAAALAKGISIAPGPIFSASGKFGNCVRLTCSAWSEAVAGAIRTVGELARQAA